MRKAPKMSGMKMSGNGMSGSPVKTTLTPVFGKGRVKGRKKARGKCGR